MTGPLLLADGGTIKRFLIVPGAALSALVFAVLAGAAPAQAQVIERSTEVATEADGAGGFNAFFGDTFTDAQSGSTFADLFTFAVAGTPFDAAASVTSSFLDSPGSKDLQITGLSLYRYDPQTLAIIGNAVAGIDLTGFGDNPVDSRTVTGLNLASGSHALLLAGLLGGLLSWRRGLPLAVAQKKSRPRGRLQEGSGRAPV